MLFLTDETFMVCTLEIMFFKKKILLKILFLFSLEIKIRRQKWALTCFKCKSMYTYIHPCIWYKILKLQILLVVYE